MSHRRFDWLLVLCTVCAGFAWWLTTRAPRGIIVRAPRVDESAARYLAEFTRSPHDTKARPRYSPDGRWLVSDTLVRDSYYTIRVFDLQTRGLLPVVTIREADPGSGRSFRRGWSSDSRALIIRGTGAFWRGENQAICLVFLPFDRQLINDASCLVDRAGASRSLPESLGLATLTQPSLRAKSYTSDGMTLPRSVFFMSTGIVGRCCCCKRWTGALR